MDGPLLTIGDLARRTGLPVRTIRFWSDAGLVPESARTAAGHRRYDAAAPARVGLVATLRGLGVGLSDVEAVLAGRRTVAEVAAVHVRALDAEIRTLRLRRAVLTAVAARADAGPEEMKLVTDLARLSAAERQRIVDDFLAEAFGPDEDHSGIRERMRALTPALPDDPTPEQVRAWVEVAELCGDPAFRARCRRMADAAGELASRAVTATASAGPDDRDAGAALAAAVTEHAGAALAAGLDPAAPGAEEVVRRVLPDADAGERAEVAERLATFTDARVDRYWQLVGEINGWAPRPPATPPFEWFIAALTARRDGAPSAAAG